MADPAWVGRHPLHEARYVTTDVQTEAFNLDTNEPSWRFEDPGAVIICTMPDAANQRANARLIAAAPDLLAACKSALKSLDMIAATHNSPLSQQIGEAIAKAEGRS